MKCSLFIFLTSVLIFSCHSHSTESSDEMDFEGMSTIDSPAMEVVVAKAVRGDFQTSIRAQGLMRTNQKMELVWDAQGYVTDLYVQEGDLVRAGKDLALLGSAQLEKDLRQANINLEKAKLTRDDMLISRMLDSDSADMNKRNNIDLLSGFRQAEFDVERIEEQMAQQRIIAPFDGIIYDIRQVVGSYVSSGQPFAKVINNKNFRIEFEVLESDLEDLQEGQTLMVRPLTGQFKPVHSTVYRIIPMVNQHGLVRVLATLQEQGDRFYDGMKIQVLINQLVPDQIIVPREAIVIRSGRKVIFTYDAASRQAKWHFVNTGSENDSSVTVTEGIKADDLVIVEGNLNLSHDAEVVVRNSIQSNLE